MYGDVWFARFLIDNCLQRLAYISGPQIGLLKLVGGDVPHDASILLRGRLSSAGVSQVRASDRLAALPELKNLAAGFLGRVAKIILECAV